MLDNVQAGRPDGTVQQRGECWMYSGACPDSSGEGETVVQETTGGPGDRAGQANPIGSKTKHEAFRACPEQRLLVSCLG